MKSLNHEIVKYGITNFTTGEKCAVLGTAATLYLITLFAVIKNDYSLKIGTLSITPQVV